MPTEAQIQTTLSYVNKLQKQNRLYGGVNTPNVIAMLAAINNSLQSSSFSDATTNATGAARNSFDGLMRQTAALQAGALRDYGILIGAIEKDSKSIMQRLYRWCIDTGVKVGSRGFTFASMTALRSNGNPNVGTGVIRRLNVDAYGYKIENQTPDLKTVRCIADQYSGARKHNERFAIWGGAQNRDVIIMGGSAQSGELVGQSGSQSGRYLENPSFSQADDDTTITDLNGWEVETGALSSCSIDRVNYYRDFDGDQNPGSLKTTANIKIRQDLATRNQRIDPDVPMFGRFAYNASLGGAYGATVRIDVGSQSTSHVIGSGESGWQLLVLDQDESDYLLNFNSQPLYVKVSVTGMPSGAYLLFDDVMFVPWTNFNNGWFVADGGETPWEYDDEFKGTDACAETGVNQREFVYANGLYLPHTTGSGITWADAA